MEDSTDCIFLEGGAFTPNGYFIRNIIMQIDDILDFRKKYKNKGIFTTAYRYNKENFYEADLEGDLYFDFDTELENEEDFERIREDVLCTLSYLRNVFGIPEDIIEIYFSGNKGIHLIVNKEILGIVPHSNLNQIFRGIAEEVHAISPHKTIDLAVYDRRRLWRMSNSQHNKTSLYKIPITNQELRELSLTDIKTLAQNQRYLFLPKPYLIRKAQSVYKMKANKAQEKKPRKKYTGPKAELKALPPCIKELLEGGVQKGQRNNSAMAIASFFHQQGMSKEEAHHKLEEWSETKCEEPLPQREIDMVIDHVYKAGYSYGCSGIKILSTCNKHLCPLFTT